MRDARVASMSMSPRVAILEKQGKVDRSIPLILPWQDRQAALEGDEGLVRLTQQHGAVGRFHLDEGRRAVAGEDAVLLAIILTTAACSRRREAG